MYEILRPKFPHVVQILQQIPNATVADIQKLDEKIALSAATKGNKIDKAKKDLFKKLTSPVSGYLSAWHGYSVTKRMISVSPGS